MLNMNVYTIAQNKIKISLTHTEVIACFGEYDRLYNMSQKTKTALTLLLNDIITAHPIFNKNCKISAKIKLKRNIGCEIVLTALSAERNSPPKECIFEFSDSESLTRGIVELYKNRRYSKLRSHLYKTENGYRLMVNCKDPKNRLFLLHEYCFKISDSPRDIEYTKEYGKPLILNCAIEKYGKAFS